MNKCIKSMCVECVCISVCKHYVWIRMCMSVYECVCVRKNVCVRERACVRERMYVCVRERACM